MAPVSLKAIFSIELWRSRKMLGSRERRVGTKMRSKRLRAFKSTKTDDRQLTVAPSHLSHPIRGWCPYPAPFMRAFANGFGVAIHAAAPPRRSRYDGIVRSPTSQAALQASSQAPRCSHAEASP